MQDKIIQIITGVDGEMPGGFGHTVYGLGKSGALYQLDIDERSGKHYWLPIVEQYQINKKEEEA